MDDRRNVAVVVNDASLFRALAGSGIEPYLLTHGRSNSLRHSRHYAGGATIADPETDPARFVTDLIAIGRRFAHAPPLFFTHDGVLLLVSANRDALTPYFRLDLPPHALVCALVHKAEFAMLARDFELPVPPTLRADTRADFSRMLAAMRTVAEQFVVQAYVPGGDDGICSYHAYLDASARPLARFVGRKLRTWPRDSGISSCLEIVEDPAVDQLGTDIAHRLRLQGPVKMDFKRDATGGRLFLLEINARCTLWHHLGAVAGVNLPHTAWAYLNGLQVPVQAPYRTGIRWISPARDLRAFLRSYRPAGLMTVRDYLTSLRSPLIFDLFAWDDPLPAGARFALGLRARLVARVKGALRVRPAGETR